MHVLHAVSPATSWNVPAAQLVHDSALALGLTVPGAQSVGALDPTLQKVPSGHVTHWLMLDIAMFIASIVALVDVPPGHGSAAAAPSAQ